MILEFTNPVFNQLAKDCGLVISESNVEVTSKEVEFLLEKLVNRIAVFQGRRAQSRHGYDKHNDEYFIRKEFLQEKL